MIKAIIIGASGYTGAELLRLLGQHPNAAVVAATSETYAGQAASTLYPHLTRSADQKFVTPEQAVETGADIVFTALPHGRSMTVVGDLIADKRRVIDLSGDFRLAAGEVYTEWYKMPHTLPGLLDSAVYGLPELNKRIIPEAGLVSNPGCYPTSAILALLPALEKNLVTPEGIVVDSLSGVSGAGRAADENTHFCVRSESVAAYKAGGGHQHIPEMEQYLSIAADARVTISFTPHLGPFSRGIYTTVYANLAGPKSIDQMLEVYGERYADEPFVKVLPAGVMPELKAVRGSNFCHIGLAVDARAGRLVVVSAIDNLIKGASGQAVQNMNIMFGLPETMGLEQGAIWP